MGDNQLKSEMKRNYMIQDKPEKKEPRRSKGEALPTVTIPVDPGEIT